MNTLNSLPPASQGAINKMNEEAQKLMQENNVVLEDQHEETSEVEQVETAAEQAAPPAVAVQESEQARNFRAIREQKERAERERDEAIRILREIEASKNQQPQEDLDFSIAPDELAEGKHLTKVQKKIKALEDKNREYERRMQDVQTMMTIKDQYKDYDSIMSTDNINKLEKEHPEIASIIMSSAQQDPYKARVSTYKFIKSLGIVPNDIAETQRVQSNSAKPRPLTSVAAQQGTSPLSKANAFENGLTDELAASLRKEMAAARKLM